MHPRRQPLKSPGGPPLADRGRVLTTTSDHDHDHDRGTHDHDDIRSGHQPAIGSMLVGLFGPGFLNLLRAIFRCA